MPATDIPLRDYQITTKNYIVSHPYCGIFLTMGLGKTSSTIAALQEIEPPGHILIVAPLNIAKITWPSELVKWSITARTRSFILNERGKKLSKAKRLERYEESLTGPPMIHFINYEMIHDLVDWMLENSTFWPFRTVIIDESQAVKNVSSRRHKALAKVRPDIDRLIELTGTPTPQGLLDLYGQIKLLDGGASLGKNITAYKDTFFYVSKTIDGIPVQWEPLPGAKEEIYSRIRHLVMSLENTQVLTPGVLPHTIYVELDAKERAEYKKFKDEMVLNLSDELGHDIAEDAEIVAASSGVLATKLMQYASGSIYVNENHDYHVIHNKKIEAVDAILQSVNSPTLIAYRFRSDRERLPIELEKLGHTVTVFDGTTEMMDRWNEGKIPVLMIHPASAGHGLNFQFGGNNIIWYTLPDSGEHWLQTNKRLDRPGQTEVVNIFVILTRGTYDMRKPDALAKKELAQDDLMRAIRIEADHIRELPFSDET